MPDQAIHGTPERIEGVEQLDEWLSEPTAGVVETLGRLDGDLMLLGVGGKMGPTLAWMARRALDMAGQPDRKVVGVARFSNPALVDWLRERRIEPVACDLLEPGAIERLPDVPLVVSMFAMKFGTGGQPDLTWVMNAFLPGLVAQRFRSSRIVAFSTGNVYPLTPAASGGPVESDALGPVGEYAMSCVGRERILSYHSRSLGTPMALIRLNYAVELRYGILVEVARKVWSGTPVDVTMGHANVIWQGDANAMTLRAFDLAASPPHILNLTGPETLSVRWLAEEFGRRFGKRAVIRGEESPDALLSNATQAMERFGPLRVTAEEMLPVVADWVARGGEMLDKPTHFEARDGRF